MAYGMAFLVESLSKINCFLQQECIFDLWRFFFSEGRVGEGAFVWIRSGKETTRIYFCRFFTWSYIRSSPPPPSSSTSSTFSSTIISIAILSEETIWEICYTLQTKQIRTCSHQLLSPQFSKAFLLPIDANLPAWRNNYRWSIGAVASVVLVIRQRFAYHVTWIRDGGLEKRGGLLDM